MDNIPRQYLGPFDRIRSGIGPGCPLESNTDWTTCVPAFQACVSGPDVTLNIGNPPPGCVPWTGQQRSRRKRPSGAIRGDRPLTRVSRL